MSITTAAHDPSVRFADTSPREAWGGRRRQPAFARSMARRYMVIAASGVL